MAILSDDPKVGSVSAQRSAFSAGVEDRIFEVTSADREFAFSNVVLREGDILLVAHARVLGRKKERTHWLAELAERGVLIQLPGGVPVLYDSEEKKAGFHAEAVKPTGRPSKRQQKMKGRPPVLSQPSPDVKEAICERWHDIQPSTGKRMKASDVYDYAKRKLKRDVARHEIKHWCGDKRGEPKIK